MPLNLRQQRFVAAYLKDPNATKAAMTAGYSKKTAASIGAENLQKPLIRAALNAAAAQVAEDAGVTLRGHLDALQDIRDAALRAKQYGAAATAEVSRGKVSGLYVERLDLTSKGKPLTVRVVRDDAADA